MRFLLLIIAGLFATPLLSQEKFFSSDCSDLSIRDQYSNVIIDEENSRFLISIADRNKIKRVLINEKGSSVNLLEQTADKNNIDSSFRYHSELSEKTLRFYKRSDNIGGIIQGGNLIEVFREYDDYDIIIIETNLKTGELVSADTIETNTEERVLFCFKKSDKLYIITYYERADVLMVYVKESAKPVSKNSMEIQVNDLGKVRNSLFAGHLNHFYEIFTPGNFAAYNNNLRYPVVIASVRNKAYFNGDKILITINSNDLNTYLIEIDFTRLTYKIKTFDQDDSIENKIGDATTASFLVDSLLVTCHLAEKKMYLKLFNINNENLIESFEIDKTNYDSIASEPVQKTGTFISKAEIKEEDFSKFYKMAVANKLSISGYKHNGKLFLSLAAPYKQFFNGNTLLSIAVSAAGTYFINASPNTYGYMFVGFRGVQNATYIGFNTAINFPLFNFGKEQPNFSVWDKMALFYSTRNLMSSRCSFFYMNNYYYIGSFSRDRDKYVINRFDQQGVPDK